MAQRQLFCKTVKQVWTCLYPTKFVTASLSPLKGRTTLLSDVYKLNSKSSPFTQLNKAVSAAESSTLTQYSERNKIFIDLFTNNPHKYLYMPTISINKLKVYEDIATQKSVTDPIVNNIKIIDVPIPGQPEKKEAVRMILIRRRKMRKHKLRKLRKRMKFVFAARKMKKLLRKEQAFRGELLSQIEVADNFDAKVYVDNILKTIRNQPKVETVEEIRERYRQIKKINKYNTTFVPPRFDD